MNDSDLTSDCEWAMQALTDRGLDQEAIALVAIAVLVAAAPGANLSLGDVREAIGEAWQRYADACETLRRST